MARNQDAADSVTGLVKAAAAAIKGLPIWPLEVKRRDGDEKYWTVVVRACAREEIVDTPKSIVAAHLAKCMADIERQTELLDGEGFVITNERGTPVSNPRAAIVETLTRRQMSLLRSLGLTGTLAGRPEDLNKKRSVEKSARKAREEIEDEDGLLA